MLRISRLGQKKWLSYKKKCVQGGLNKKEIQLNLCNIFFIFIINELYLFT